MNTAKEIMVTLERWSAEKRAISPTEWIDAAAKIMALSGNEDDLWFEMEQKCANMRITFIENGCTVAKAKAMVEASEEYLQARKQKAFCERIKETVRIAKLRGRMASDELRN